MPDDYCVNLKVSSETVTAFGFSHRIVSEEISGSSNESANTKNRKRRKTITAASLAFVAELVAFPVPLCITAFRTNVYFNLAQFGDA